MSEPVKALVDVDYDDFKPWTFRGVIVSIGDDERRFESLDEAYAFAEKNADIVLNLSSVDDYKSDLKNIKLN